MTSASSFALRGGRKRPPTRSGNRSRSGRRRETWSARPGPARSSPRSAEEHDRNMTVGSPPPRRRTRWRRPEIWESRSDVERIAFFSDAVFAIAMTLLVVQLSVPTGPAGELGHTLRARGSKFFAFGLSFLVIGQYWLAHHRVFRHIRRYDLGLLWLNLLWLLAIAFLPFPTAVLGN